MKRILSLILVILMLAAYLPATFTFAEAKPQSEDTKSKEYYTDFDAENGYIGNYALISNNEVSTTSFLGSGDLTGLIAEEPEAEDPEPAVEPADITTGDAEYRETVSTSGDKTYTTLSPTTQYNVGDSLTWFYVGDAYTIYDPYVEVIGSLFTCRAVGDHCNVWASTQYDSSKYAITPEAANVLAAEFDEIYSSIVNTFGVFGEAGAKVNILAHNLSSGIESYFYDFEYVNLGNNAGQYFFHVDTYPTMTDGNDNWDVSPAFEPMASAFVKMLITIRTSAKVPDWIKQVLSESGIAVCYNEDYSYDRIMNWAEETETYANGRSIYSWDPSDLNGYTAFHYAFGQYLRTQYGDYSVFGNILDYYASGYDTTGATAIVQSLEGSALEGMTLGEIVQNFRMATCIVDDAEGSIYGFGGESIFNFLPKTVFYGTSANIFAGGALLVKTTDSSVFNPPSDAASKLKYVGITLSIDDLPAVHSVKFFDWDETLIVDQLVFHGYPATAPAEPYRVGYTFTGWDTDFSNVTESIDVHAQYDEGETYCTITFYDDDRTTVLYTQQVIRTFKAVEPETPTRDGYAFTDWKSENGNYYNFNATVYDDINLYATWVRAVTMYGFKTGVYCWTHFETSDTHNLTQYIETDTEIIRNMVCAIYLDDIIYGFNGEGDFVTIDFKTKEATRVNTISINSSLNISALLDMTYDYTEDIAYITYVNTSYTGYLAKVNLNTGKITNISAEPEYYMSIACNKEGDMYATISRGNLVKVNKTNARYTLVGDMDFSPTSGSSTYFSSLTFDYSTGNLYWSAKSYSTQEPHLFLVNTETAHASDLGMFDNGSAPASIFIPYIYDVTTYYNVDFVDFDGTILKTQTVAEGESATAPENPERYGYVFTGWDKDFSNVQSDLRIVAQYMELETFTVTFADWDMNVLDTQTVYKGYAATAPESPTRDGYTFTGWDKDFSNVQSNLIVIAQYIKDGEGFTVTFCDWDGTVLSTQIVVAGDSATAPADPEREGYFFSGWDTDFTNVQANITVTALYVENGDTNGDNTVNTGDAVFMLRYVVGIIELTDEALRYCDVNGDGNYNTGDAVYILRITVGLA